MSSRMNIINSQPHWTPEAFENLVGKLVHRTKITKNFKNVLSKINRKTALSKEDGCKLLKILFEDSKIMKNLYGSPEELMHDLVVIQNFPNNSEFLGYPDGQLNHLATRIQMKDTEGIGFCSKIEAFQEFNKTQKQNGELCLITKSIENRLAREMKDSFELIPIDLFEKRINIETSKYIWKPEALRELPNTINNIEKYFLLCSELYDKNHDKELSKELRQILEQKCMTTTFSWSPDFFLDFYNFQVLWKNALEYALGFGKSSSHWFRRKYPVVRVFKNDNERFMMSNELENALNVAMMDKFGREFPKGLLPMETDKDRELGIVRAVEWEELESISKISGLSVYDIHIIPYDLAQTSRDTPVPINTPYGTYCILAKHAFWNVFERIILEIGPVSKENYSRIFKWLAEFDDIFSDSREYRYFIETWKIDKIMDKAYRKTINKMTRNEEGCLEDMNIIKNRFLDQNPNFVKFVIHQGVCIRPGRFYDLVKKVGDLKEHEKVSAKKLDDIVIQHEKVFMKILPTIPYDKFIPRIEIVEMVTTEMAKISDVGSPTNWPIHCILLEFENRYLHVEGRNAEEFVKRRQVPLESAEFPQEQKNMLESFEKFMGMMCEEAKKEFEKQAKRGGPKGNFVDFLKKYGAIKMAVTPKGHRDAQMLEMFNERMKHFSME